MTCMVQDARKGILFEDLPPVLQLQLKRFEYDCQRDAMVKVRAPTQSVACPRFRERNSFSCRWMWRPYAIMFVPPLAFTICHSVHICTMFSTDFFVVRPKIASGILSLDAGTLLRRLTTGTSSMMS